MPSQLQASTSGDAPVSLVIGGTSGIGAAVAGRLAARGDRVVICGSRSAVDADETVERLQLAGYVQADMSDTAEPARVLAEIEATFGRLDHLVYSAGATARIPHPDLAAVTEAVWDRILGMNVRAPWRLVTAAEPLLRASGNGSVTFVGALAGVDVGGSSIPYAVSKAALHHMAKLLGAVLGPEVRINAVAPGLIETPWTEGDAFAGLFERVRTATPLRRAGTADDVADVVVSLMNAQYVTGQTVVIDGGLSLVV